MSEKELLYIEDMLGHLEYLKKHLEINIECLTTKENILKKIDKKISSMYKNFYDLLGGDN